MQIPKSNILSTKRLGKVFDNTVATYKYFWFVSIMQIHAKNDNPRIDVWDVVIRMVANAWYPIHYFRLSFGKSDSFFDIVMELQRITEIPVDANAEVIINRIKELLEDRQIRKQLNILTLNVPYRFLRPWIDTSDDDDERVIGQGIIAKCQLEGLNPVSETDRKTAASGIAEMAEETIGSISQFMWDTAVLRISQLASEMRVSMGGQSVGGSNGRSAQRDTCPNKNADVIGIPVLGI